MKIYKTQSEVEKDIKNNVLVIKGDVRFECDISIEASIEVINGNIDAWNIDAWNIEARNINAEDINARNINAEDIDTRDIDAWNIDAWNILYYAFCCVYRNIKCRSIKAKRERHQEPICLDGKLDLEEEDLSGEEVEVKIKGKVYKAKII